MLVARFEIMRAERQPAIPILRRMPAAPRVGDLVMLEPGELGRSVVAVAWTPHPCKPHHDVIVQLD